MKIIVTGGAGFVGSHVVDAFCDGGHEVICIDSLDQYVHRSAPEYLNPKARYCFSDLRSCDFDDPDFEGVEYIVHLAALGGVARAQREPVNVIEANSLGTARLAAFAAGQESLRRFILVSSFSVYGSNYDYRCSDCGTKTRGYRSAEQLERGLFDVLCPSCDGSSEIIPIDTNAEVNPLDIYASSKFMQELALKCLPDDKTVVLRPSSIYGPRMRYYDSESTIIAKICGWVISGETPRLFEDGLQLRDWVHVDDMIGVIVGLVEKEMWQPIVNICSGVGVSLLDACHLLADGAGVECIPEVVGGFRPGDMRHCLGDPSGMEEILGRKAIPFTEGYPALLKQSSNRSDG